MRSAPLSIRSSCAALLALLLALRLLSPAGFMPAFDHGTVTIIACPDYEPVPAPMAHHHGKHGAKHDHPPCPYAAGAAAGTVQDRIPLVVALLFADALPSWGTQESSEARRSHERPPLRGPPVTA